MRRPKQSSREGIRGQRGVNLIPRWRNLRRECAHKLRTQYPVAESCSRAFHRPPPADSPRLLTHLPLQGHTCPRGFFDSRIHLQAETISEPRQLVEDPHDVRDLKQRFVVEAQFAQRLPIFRRHPGRSRTQLLSNLTQCAGSRLEIA